MTPATESTPVPRSFSEGGALAVDAILARFAKKGIGSIATARTLLFIYDQGNPTMGEIASHNGKTGAALTCTIDRLEKAGHVRRVRPNGDRRSIRIELTFTGRQFVHELLTA